MSQLVWRYAGYAPNGTFHAYFSNRPRCQKTMSELATLGYKFRDLESPIALDNIPDQGAFQ